MSSIMGPGPSYEADLLIVGDAPAKCLASGAKRGSCWREVVKQSPLAVQCH
jgi:hypothetical protein